MSPLGYNLRIKFKACIILNNSFQILKPSKGFISTVHSKMHEDANNQCFI